MALGNIAICFTIFAHPVGEDGAEERSHERDTGTYAANARFEQGPKERFWYGECNVRIGEAEEGDKP